MSQTVKVESIDCDEYVEATPKSLCLRKRILRCDRAKVSRIKRNLCARVRSHLRVTASSLILMAAAAA